MDKGTSGVMTIPTNPQSASYFGKLIRDRLVRKKYKSLNLGLPIFEKDLMLEQDIEIGLKTNPATQQFYIYI